MRTLSVRRCRGWRHPYSDRDRDRDRDAAAEGKFTSDAQISRSILPIPDVPHVGLITCDAKDPDTSYPPIGDIQAPDGAPNVLVILIDDVGFGASSAFGGTDILRAINYFPRTRSVPKRAGCL